MKEDIAYLGADSRKNFTDGSYSDNHQKIFINRNLKMVWTMTGITEYRNINYFYMIFKINQYFCSIKYISNRGHLNT